MVLGVPSLKDFRVYTSVKSDEFSSKMQQEKLATEENVLTT